jgi:protein TonB
VRTGFLIAASLTFHVGLFVTISQRSKQIEKRQTLIAMVEQKKKEAEKVEPPKPIEAPKEVLQPKLLKAPVVAPPPEPANPAPSPAMEALPDYGLNLQGGTGGPGGLAVPENKGGRPGGTGDGGAPHPPVEKTLGQPQAPGPAKDPDLSEDIAAWKPKPTARVKPVYPDEARSSEIEGTVVVEAVIDCSGKVTSARVLQGLGHGLDEAAMTAIRKTEFEPAARCRALFQKSMKINYAFRLGD